MNQQTDILTNTFNWFEEAIPDPTSKNLHTQLGVHCEEIVEMLQEMDGQTEITTRLIANAEQAMHELAEHLKATDLTVVIPEYKRIRFLDALCDQVVTATGVADLAGFDFPGAMAEVNRSNWSKFVDGKPIFNENKKIMKGPDYRQADLEPYV